MSSRPLLADWLTTLTERCRRPIAPEAVGRLYALSERVLEAAQHQNLTALRDRERLLLEGVGPSLALWPLLPERGPMVDIGSGAGMPGVVLACLEPGRPWLLIESRQRRAEFLAGVVAELGLRATVRAERAEQTGHGPHRQQAVGVTARRIGALGVVAELGLPLLRVGGQLLSPCGEKTPVPGPHQLGLIGLLGGRLEWVAEPELPGFQRRGRVAVIEKHHPTPARYPRQPPALGSGVLVLEGVAPAGSEVRPLGRRGG